MSTWGYPIPWNQFQSDRSPSKFNHIIEEPGYVNHAAPPGGHLKHKRCSNEVPNYLGQCVTGTYGKKIQLLYHKWTPDGFLLFKIKSRPFFGPMFRSGAAIFQAIATKFGRNVVQVPGYNIKQTAFKSDHYKGSTEAAAVCILQRKNTKKCFRSVLGFGKRYFSKTYVKMTGKTSPI